MSSTNQGPAMDRIAQLLDAHSFVEIGAAVHARSTDFSMQEQKTPSDGVVCGYGTVDDRLVFVYSQDASVMGGSIGEMHAKKIAALYDKAIAMGAPIIGMLDSTGVRLEEASDALEGLGAMMAASAKASGTILQIAMVYGPCGGGLATFASMADVVMMEKNASFFFNSPNAIEGNFKEKNDTSSAEYRATSDGVVDIAGDSAELCAKARKLLEMLPANCEEGEVINDSSDDLNRGVSVAGKKASEIIEEIADAGSVVMLKPGYAECVSTALISLDGITVGVYGNNGNEICAGGCEKAADFITFCDAFCIPVLSLTNVSGFKAAEGNEKRLGRAIAKLNIATAEASVPKVNFIVGEALGSAYLSMNSKALGADLVYALEGAKVAPMDAKLAAPIIAGEGADLAKVASDFENNQASLQAAAGRGYIDRIVSDADARKYIISAFEMLLSKGETPILKKHASR